MNGAEKHLILINLDPSNPEEKQLSDAINDKQASNTRLILALKKAKQQFSKRRKSEMDAFDKRVEQAKKDKVKIGKLKTAFKYLKVRDFGPMLYLKEIGRKGDRRLRGGSNSSG